MEQFGKAVQSVPQVFFGLPCHMINLELSAVVWTKMGLSNGNMGNVVRILVEELLNIVCCVLAHKGIYANQRNSTENVAKISVAQANIQTLKLSIPY